MSELPQGWAETGVLDVADSLDSQRVPVNGKEREQRPGSVPYYGATGQVGWIDEPLFDEELCLLGEDGAPFLDRSKPKAYVIDGPSWVNNHAHVLRAIAEATSNRFLKYALDQFDYNSVVYGTTRLKLTKSAMRRMTIPLPPRAEQSRIVAAIEEHFSRLDAAEESLAYAKRRVSLLRISSRSQAVSGDWPVVALGEVTESQKYGSSAKASADSDGIPILRMGNIRDGALDFKELKYLPADHPDCEKCRLQPGDLLFNRTNSPELVGKSAVFKAGPGPTIFASYLIRVRLIPECDPDWTALVMNSHLGRRYVASVRTQQVGQANVNGTKLAAMPIPLPPLEEQRRILSEVERQISLIDATDARIDLGLRRSAALRRSILERAFTGKLVPQDSSDEPASVLLERISAERAATSKPSRRKRKIPA